MTSAAISSGMCNLKYSRFPIRFLGIPGSEASKAPAFILSLRPTATRQKGRDFMRKFKTSEDNRTNYIYYFNDGSKCVITPGEDGENTTIIAQLHKMDDEQLDADCCEEYHCPVHYQVYSNGEGEDADDRNPYLCDTASDPLEQMLASINEQEYSEKLDRLKETLTILTDLQRDTIYKKFYRNMSNVNIAAEEGVSEAAIRNRLKKIFANLAKKI